MAITQMEIDRSKQFLVSKGATQIILFGSAMQNPQNACDLDLACRGIPPEIFYAVAGKIERVVGKPVDLIDLTDNTPFTQRVEKIGQVLYESR
ncbi:MAG: nucleotidyltransferase domain-containing protein [Candidatus Sumerlaeota bacterium]|nr:nucleotidyltransferase domain-containing protein [Candidatus Sumerlaeota bacterium]